MHRINHGCIVFFWLKDTRQKRFMKSIGQESPELFYEEHLRSVL